MYRHGATLLRLRLPKFSSTPLGKYRHRTSKKTTTAFFNILSNSNELKSIYEGWNFNSDNYLFTTDTK